MVKERGDLQKVTGGVEGNKKVETKDTKGRVGEIVRELSRAFGGFSQLSNEVVGQAIMGQVNTRELDFGITDLDELVDSICDRLEEGGTEGVEVNPENIRAEIIRGMEEQLEGLTGGGNNYLREVIAALKESRDVDPSLKSQYSW